jgi:ribose 5-phosphate isomerase B
MKNEKVKIGICADHGGYDLKETIREFLTELKYEVVDFGAFTRDDQDDFPDFVIPLAKAIANNEIHRGIAICGSGVGASIAANKISGVRAALIHEHFSAHQGVEDDDMNMICLGGRVTGISAAEELILTFLNAEFKGDPRFVRRLNKIKRSGNN